MACSEKLTNRIRPNHADAVESHRLKKDPEMWMKKNMKEKKRKRKRYDDDDDDDDMSENMISIVGENQREGGGNNQDSLLFTSTEDYTENDFWMKQDQKTNGQTIPVYHQPD